MIEPFPNDPLHSEASQQLANLNLLIQKINVELAAINDRLPPAPPAEEPAEEGVAT